MDVAEVKNAADPEQVKRAVRKERRAEAERAALYVAVLKTYDGRAVFWDLLAELGVYRSVFHRDRAEMAYRCGQQDFGHALLALLTDLDPALFIQMETEGRTRQTRAAAATTAAHLARADEGDET